MARSIGQAAAVEGAPLDVGEVYDAHAEFVWASLHRLGVRASDLPDLTQEVFTVVHRRRGEYVASEPVRGWLWGICVGLVRNYRRRAFRRAEQPIEREVAGAADPEQELALRRQRERGERALRELDPDKRAVFVMFEVEGMSGKAIAEWLGVPIGTVHSRLHAARKELLAAIEEGEER